MAEEGMGAQGWGRGEDQKSGPSKALDTVGGTPPPPPHQWVLRAEQPPSPDSKQLSHRHPLLPPDLILALGVLAQGLPMARHTRVPWRQLFRKPSVW